MSDFSLHPQLAADCHPVAELVLSQVLLFDDCRYPWVILVPRRDGLREIHEMTLQDRACLLQESCLLGACLMRLFAGDKLNVAALGNVVPQLHLHHVVRYRTDPAWPAPVWGHSPAVAYAPPLLAERLAQLRDGLLRGD